MKKRFAIILASVIFLSGVLAGCSSSIDTREMDVSIDEIQLGEDHTDLKASITFLTFRNDLLDQFSDYVKEFNKLYPNIEVKYEGISDYEHDVLIRLTSNKKWGDIMMIPHISKKETSEYFMPYGDISSLDKIYNYMSIWEYDEKVYGIPSTGIAYGIVYNKAVFAKAGVNELPKTPDEFLEALRLIKTNTNAIPLYTNYAAGWTMSCWDAYIGSCATGNADYINQVFVREKIPFSNRGNGTYPYAVYKILYDAVEQKLIEDDYTTTDDMGSYAMINKGEIACLVQGSWAIAELQAVGPKTDDVSYMPFPISVNGKQYVPTGPEYSYGINKHSSYDNRLASMIYVKWLTHNSGFYFSEQSMPVVKSDRLPDLYSVFDGLEFVTDTPPLSGEESFLDDLNKETGLLFNAYGNEKVQKIIEHAFKGDRSFDDIMDEWNSKWNAAQKKFGIETR